MRLRAVTRGCLIGGVFRVWTLLGVLCLSGFQARTSDLEALEKAACIRNLRLIHDALQAYRRDHLDLPGSLSELFPKYLSNGDLLFCPAARRKGSTSAAFVNNDRLAEPKTSYYYEFNLLPIEEVPGKTSRDWKRAQMGLIGSGVPIVRCLGAHTRNLNLGFDGQIYESDLYWEDNFTNVVRREDLLNPLRMLAPQVVTRYVHVPARDPTAQPQQIDLTHFYNNALAKPWISREPNHQLAELTAGLQKLGGISFDIRGIIQLSSSKLIRQGDFFPDRVLDIPVGRPCESLAFLLGAPLEAENGLEAARVVVHFDTGPPITVPLQMGTDVGWTWSLSGRDRPPSRAAVAWTGPSPGPGQLRSPRLFLARWENPKPQVRVQSLDLVSTLTEADVFIVAITAQP